MVVFLDCALKITLMAIQPHSKISQDRIIPQDQWWILTSFSTDSHHTHALRVIVAHMVALVARAPLLHFVQAH